MFWAYILENPNGKFTHKNGLWKLVHSEYFPTRSEAMAREKQIKSMESSRWIRESLIARVSPDSHRD